MKMKAVAVREKAAIQAPREPPDAGHDPPGRA